MEAAKAQATLLNTALLRGTDLPPNITDTSSSLLSLKNSSESWISERGEFCASSSA